MSGDVCVPTNDSDVLTSVGGTSDGKNGEMNVNCATNGCVHCYGHFVCSSFTSTPFTKYLPL